MTDLRSEIICGDALTVVRSMDPEAIQCVVTSPPYWGLRDYGIAGQLGQEPTPELYVDHLVEVFCSVRRVLRDDGTLWLNLGDSYYSSPSGQNGTSGTLDGGIPCAGQGTTTGRLRRPKHSLLKPKDLIGIPWRVAFALQADGWYLRSDIIWHKTNPMPESVTDRPTKAHEYLFLLTKRERYYYNAAAIKEPSVDPDRVRSDVVGGASFNERQQHSKGGEFSGSAFRNKRSVWTLPTKPYVGAHFATFPPRLIEPCILAGTKPGDTVLDPFAGSGTTLVVSKNLGRNAIGIELNPEYVELAKQRLREEASQLPLLVPR